MNNFKRSFVLFVFSFILIPSTLFTQTSDFVKTMQVDALWGQGLTGAGYDKVGMWFSSSDAPFDHSEFGDRLLNADGYSGSATNHETATAGVIIAEGQNELARGIAYQASLKVFDTNDFLTEISTEAGRDNGLEIASYSFAGSNNLGRAYYGYYESMRDEIAFINKQFLFFQSCGHRADVTGVSGQGKNELSVGSVYALSAPYSSPGDIISGGSKIGPAFDGRIKPDIVAPGGPNWMCTIDNGYAITGPATSYAAPAAAGASVLLQQHYQNTHNQTPMLSSELKGLLIHTAEEAGPGLGPDAEFGWGLINAKRAAQLITNDIWRSEILSAQIINNSDASSFERKIFSDGTDDLKVTICWIDPPGEAGDPWIGNNYYIDPSPRLINDLDLKIVKKDDILEDEIFYPFTLNQSDPTGDALYDQRNYLDNVEQVIIENPDPGYYTITIGYEGMLTNGSQEFSLIVTGDISIAPYALKEQILTELIDYYPLQTNNKVIDKLGKAIEHLEKSLEVKHWEDEYGPTKDGRKKVFDEEKKTVHELFEIVKDDNINEFKEEAGNFIIRILDIDSTMAQLKLNTAIELGGKQKYIDEAIDKMTEAQEKREKGEYEKTIDKYKQAWEKAYKALEEVGLAKWETTEQTASISVIEKESGFKLGDNYPNPFNPTTTISYEVPKPTDVSLTIYNLLGERINILVNEFKGTGNYQVQWSGTDYRGRMVSNGMYLYELIAGDRKIIKRMTLMK